MSELRTKGAILTHVAECKLCQDEIMSCILCERRVDLLGVGPDGIAMWRCEPCKLTVYVASSPDVKHFEVWRRKDSGEEICDFCSGKPALWAFGAHDFTYEGVVLSEMGVRPAFKDQESVARGSLGEWAACNDCKRDVESGDKEAMAYRAVQNIIWPKLKKHERTQTALVNAVRGTMEFHRGFFENRTNQPAMPIAEWPDEALTPMQRRLRAKG